MIILNLLRVRQWYKNFVIFLALLFGGLLFDVSNIILMLLGFLCLCFASSSNYIINDIVDKEKDKLHPDKRLRPIASGEVSVIEAAAISMILLFGSLSLAYLLSFEFSMFVLALFALGQLYSFFLKNEPFADILAISTNFVVRAVSGSVLVNLSISPWLILCTFFLALFLASAKRHSDLLLLKDKAMESRHVLKYYTLSITNALMTISASLLILSYSLYSLLGNHKMLMVSLPFSLYVIIRYYYLAESGSPIARNAELALKDIKIVMGVMLWVAIAVFVIMF